MSRIIIILVCFMQYTNLINCQGFYSILAPSIIRPNSEYHITVSIHQSSEPVTVKLGIISGVYSNFKTVEVRPFSSELVQFEILELKPDIYSLTAEGVAGIIFTNETRLQYEPKQLSVFVQTDKAIYKPGDLVRYRILLLDPNTKPAKDYGDVHIEIKDGGGNVIKQLMNARLTSSIYSDELQLASDFPALGEWSINVLVMGTIHRKTFEVAEYVMPKFDVSIDTTKYAVYKDGKITATIRAKCHYGKPIKGEATVSIYPKFYGSIQPFVFNLITRKVVSLDGKAYVEFDIKNELKFFEDYKRDILLEAIVEEQLTGRKQNTSTVVTLHRDRYNIETLRKPDYYIPNVPFEILVKVVQHDGTPLKDPTNPVVAYWTKTLGNNDSGNRTEFKLNNQGLAKLRFTIPETVDNDQQLIIVSYLDVSTEIGMIERKHINNDTYIQATILNDNPEVNEEVTVSVQSSERLKYFMYQIVGRGDILLSKTVDVSDSNYHTFKFRATSAMVPRANLLVLFIANDGEMIFDEQTINFGDELSNFIRIEAPAKSSPGQEVDITITTKPFSYIGLMAVDQNAANIRNGNDLSREFILEELGKYDTHNSRIYRGSPGYNSGVVLLTNSDYYVNRTVPLKIPQTTPPVMMEADEKLTKKTDIGPAHTFEVNTKPPLAGPYAFSRIPKPFWNRPRIHVMNEVMDTWFFMNISSGNEGRTTIHKKLPNGMTSWVLTGFSLDPVTGLGLSRLPKNIENFRTFYITTDLPYSIRRDEIIAIPFVIFNNQNRDIESEVTMYNTAQEFEFIQINNELENKPKVELYSRKSLKVLANSAQSISFMIRPTKLGHIIIKAVATSSLAGDTVEQTLLVEPAGATENINRGIFIDLRSKNEIKGNVTIQIPRNSVPDSTQIEVSVVGDILGSTIKNLEELLKLPNGNGEQNMVNFVPSIIILKYLEKMNKLSPAIETKAKKYIEIGYQRQLFYRHLDGSFSAFGQATDKIGSTWLTAYVARYLKQASAYTQIDVGVIKEALTYLSKIQANDGSFPEMGDVIESHDMDGVSLTAFTLLGFLENANNIPEYRNVINKAIDYIVRSLAVSDDLYSLAISAYALTVAGHNSKNSFVQRLDTFAKQEDGKKWYAKPYPTSEKSNPWYNKTRSVNIEISSYAALALIENNLLTEAMPILNWLVDQRNMMGGFVSSQDTVTGLEALVKFAELLRNRDSNVQVIFEFNDGFETRMNVNDENSIVLQSYQLPNSARNVSIVASGRGLALAQVSYKYNTNVTGAWPRFSLDPQVNRISHADYLHLSICTSFVPVIGGANQSNMAVMEVTLPSGFTVDLDTLPSLEANNRIKKVETRKRDTVVVIYFDYLDRIEICPTLDAYKTHKITKHKSVPVIIYDVYDNARKARMFYNAPKSTLCDICEGTNCGNSCGPLGQRQSRVLNDQDDKKNKNNLDGSGGGCSTINISIALIMSVSILRKFL